MADCSENSVNLDTLPGVWRGRTPQVVFDKEIISTGFKELDEVLPGGGWPLGGLTEILSRRSGSGELTLMLPAMAQLSRQNRWVTWIAPPHIPYAPALAAAGIRLSRMLLIRPRRVADLLWSAEQALRHGHRSAVLIWLEGCNVRTLRRLQLAASEGESLGIIFRSQQYAATPSPAMLRLKVESGNGELAVDMLKCRGTRPVHGLRLSNDTLSGSVPGEQIRPGEHAFTNL